MGCSCQRWMPIEELDVIRQELVWSACTGMHNEFR